MAYIGALVVTGYLLVENRLRKSIGFFTYISLAYGSAAISPVEGTAEGTIVVDQGIDSMLTFQ